MPRNTLNGHLDHLLRLGQHDRLVHRLARRLERAGEGVAQHDGIAAEQQRLDERAVAPHAAVGDERHGRPSASAMRHSTSACTWGTPKLVFRRVVQPPPGPMPTLMPLTPRSARNRAPSAVATLPAISSTSPNRPRNCSIARAMTTEWPCAMSMTRTSTPARISSAARSRKSPLAPIAAPTRSRPCASRVANGMRFCLRMSFAVMRPVKHAPTDRRAAAS